MSDPEAGIPCLWMRGGTSKGAFFLAKDLPAEARARDDVLLRIMGSPDARQIDGIGGADPLTSKVALLGPSTRADADVDRHQPGARLARAQGPVAVDDRHRQQRHAGPGRQQGGTSLGIVDPAIALAGAVDEHARGPALQQSVGGGADGIRTFGFAFGSQSLSIRSKLPLSANLRPCRNLTS